MPFRINLFRKTSAHKGASHKIQFLPQESHSIKPIKPKSLPSDGKIHLFTKRYSKELKITIEQYIAGDLKHMRSNTEKTRFMEELRSKLSKELSKITPDKIKKMDVFELADILKKAVEFARK